MKKLIILLPFVFACSLSPNGNRYLASDKPLHKIFERLEKDLKLASQDGVSLETCAGLSKSYFKEFYNLDAQENLISLSTDELTELINRSYKMRQEIRSQLKVLKLGQPLTEDCLAGVRDLTRALRYTEDYLINIYAGEDAKAEDFVTLEGSQPYFQQGKNFIGVNDLQSGDVILSRGNAFTSAAIARLGSVDAQFSHASLVYKDMAGKIWTIEAHIELGSVVNPIQVNVDQKNSRSAVFRFKDTKLAEQAAKFMFDRVLKQQLTGKTVKYDFTMDYLNNEKLFCSEVIYQGYKDGAGEDVPYIKTRFNRGLLPFLKSLGVNVDSSNVESFRSFFPGDLEFDSRFELIAEWRNPGKIKASRIRDAVLTKMFDWMEKDGYVLHPVAGPKVQSVLAWTLRRMPFIKKSFIEKLSLDMTTKQLQLFITLEKVGAVLEGHLLEIQASKEYPLTLKEMFSELQKLKEKDLELYQKGEKTKFHKLLRPAK